MSAGFFSQTSPYIMNQDLSLNNPIENQGLFSIISSDFNSSHKKLPTHSIRRTFSADMSSPKWLQNNEFPLKKVQSLHQLQVLGEEDDHDHDDCNDHDHDHDDCNDHDHNKGPEFEDIWSSIQAGKKSWESILSPTKNDGPGSGSDPAQSPLPYVHPLAKRSASSLSEKSLEICTESLGSETGSDGFSSGSEKEHEEEEVEEEKEKENKEVEQEVVEMKCKDFNGNGSYKVGPTSKRCLMVPPTRPSFPPPLPSLANRNDGSNLRIRSHRQDGRLIVEAVSVPSQNCFRVQRQDGRLVLTLATTHGQTQEQEDGNKEENIEELDTTNMEKSSPSPNPNLTTLAMMSKFININKSTWPRNHNKTVIKTLDDKEEVEVTLLPRQRIATAALNAYEYYWRTTSSPTGAAAMAMLNPLTGQQNNNVYSDALQMGKDTKSSSSNNNNNTSEEEEVVLVKAARRRGATNSTEEKGEYLVPFMLRGCKDHKRSFFLLDPYCIAT